jgi:DNA-binding LytR/AlgR family response regulator
MLKCIIVDDQSNAVQILKGFIKKNPLLECVGSYADPGEAYLMLKEEPADLIFLEAKKTKVAGGPSIATFQSRALIVLTSSQVKYAMTGFDHGVVDFLIKPLKYDRFCKAAEKAHRIKFPVHADSHRPAQIWKGGYIFIKESTRWVRLELDDIYYVMGLKNYVSIVTKSQRIVSLQTMKQLEDLLPLHRFMRVHRSYFVAMDKIISVEKQQIYVKDKIIPIGNIYLSQFMKSMENAGRTSS